MSVKGPQFIRPDWPAPASIVAFSTTRAGGHSLAPYDSLNLGMHVGDNPEAVAQNRELLLTSAAGLASLNWLEQVHGTVVVEARPSTAGMEADAQWSSTPGVGCAILTADCLPVLFCASNGDTVAAAHAGWRGLQSGVLEQTLAQMVAPRESVMAWLGPAIGPQAFEVGPEVLEAFLQSASPELRSDTAACFSAAGGASVKYFADLYRLARIRLRAAGVKQIYGGGDCTFNSPDLYFSYRRTAVTGRMASVIGIRQA